MHLTTAQKLAILAANPGAIAVYTQPLKNGPGITVLTTDHLHPRALKLPPELHPDAIKTYHTPPFEDLRLALQYADSICYNEPVPGGVQIQPAGAAWVGTLGAPCRFNSRSGKHRWGILSNWHVMCDNAGLHGTPIHQPTEQKPAIAALEDWEPVNASKPNTFDAAVADAKIHGLHTIGREVKCVGRLNPNIVPPSQHMGVCKCGRTTGLTRGICTATDAAVKVGYGDFVATFTDQALFEAGEGSFSAPGDSGSLIVRRDTYNPVALLFAGNDIITIGSPLGPIQKRFNLSFHFPE